ncbi:extensin-like [Onychomys torridus]|uniref:extensin-like n=1 Tax=Onychomys torridus TaxID=38674 RepID=UPI00167F8274|nr:extensin-like [Onychomys torridus]
MAAWGEVPGKVQVMPSQHLGLENRSVSYPFFCLLLASTPLGNPSPSTPESSHPVPDSAPRTRSQYRPAGVPRPDPGIVVRRPRPPVLRAAPCPARAGEGTLPGQPLPAAARPPVRPDSRARPRPARPRSASCLPGQHLGGAAPPRRARIPAPSAAGTPAATPGGPSLAPLAPPPPSPHPSTPTPTPERSGDAPELRPGLWPAPLSTGKAASLGTPKPLAPIYEPIARSPCGRPLTLAPEVGVTRKFRLSR